MASEYQQFLKRCPIGVQKMLLLVQLMGERAFKVGMTLGGPILMLFGHTIVVGLVYGYFATPVVPETVSRLFYVPWTAFGWFLVFNIFFNWHLCAFTSPGLPPIARYPNNPELNEFPVCHKCSRLKPPRAHHCSGCGHCVLAMDHHCPWMNNCIGFYNYKYFFLMLLYTWSAIAFLMISCAMFHPVVSYFVPGLSKRWYTQEERQNLHLPSGVVFSMVLSTSLIVAVSSLLFWHIYLAMTGSTTIDFYKSRDSSGGRPSFGNVRRFNDYDLGSAKNWELIFGKWKYPLGWTLPSLSYPKGDGMHWPTVKTVFFGEDAV